MFSYVLLGWVGLLMAPGHGKASDEPVRSEAKQCGQLLLGSRLSAGLPMDLSAEADAFLQQLQSDAAAEAAPAPAAGPAGDAVPAEAPPVVSEPEAAAAPPEGAAQAEAAPAQPAAEPAVAPPAAASQPAPDAAAAGAEPAQQNGGVTDGAEAGANGADGSAEQPRKRRNRWGAPAVEPEAAWAQTGSLPSGRGAAAGRTRPRTARPPWPMCCRRRLRCPAASRCAGCVGPAASCRRGRQSRLVARTAVRLRQCPPPQTPGPPVCRWRCPRR